MLQARIAAVLGTHDIFATLEPAGREILASRMRPVSFTAGQVIFSRDDAARELYLIETGRVRISILTSEGRELSLTHIADGGLFGEIAVFDGGPRSATATALDAVSAYSLSRPALLSLMDTTPAIARAAVTFFCRRLRETDEKLEAIALYPIEARLARFLLSAVRLQFQKLDKPKMTLNLDMSQSELALLIGATRPKVNGALLQLESTGAVQRQGKQVICDIDALRMVAGSD